MHTQHITHMTTTPAELICLALLRLDDKTMETVVKILLRESRKTVWLEKEIDEAISNQIEDQRKLDQWIEAEEARHGDVYACSKEGDATYWC